MRAVTKKIRRMTRSVIIVFTSALCATGSSDRPIAPAFDVLYKCLDSTYTLQQMPGSSSPGRNVMICIMPDKFAQVFQTYAEWKHKSGTFIKIVKFSDIGATNTAASCSTAIKPYIKNAFDKWTFKPTYVLLVGDAGVFPVQMYTVSSESAYITENATDEYFGEVNSANGYEPDLMVGRLCVKDTAELGTLLKKMMQYERTPPMTNATWFKRGVALSDNEIIDSAKPTLQVETVREASKIQIAAGFTVDTLMCTSKFTGDLSTVIKSINKGCSFINYRGTGWSSGWESPCYPIGIGSLPEIQNGGMLPFITGIGCGIARFNTVVDGFGGGDTECFAEEWMRLGTAAAPRGAIAVIGPAGETHSYWNNEIDKGIYRGMFQKGLTTPGQALIAGIHVMYKKTSLGRDTTDFLARLFLVIGDPSIHIWKDVPQTATVTNPTTIPVGSSSQTITVKMGSQPVKNAQVCISGALTDSVTYVSGFTDSNGTVKLSINTHTASSTVSFVARGGNILPVEKQITVVTTGAMSTIENHSALLSLKATCQSPTAPEMTVSFSLPKAGQAMVAIHSLSGALVRTLACGMQSAGIHFITWNGRSDNGIAVARGVYLVSLRQTNSPISQLITKF
jgi:hypothetical protein